MGVWDYLFDSKWIQRADINRLDEQADVIRDRIWEAHSNSRKTNQEIDALRQELCRLMLLVDVFGRVIVEKNLCTREELSKFISAADAEDGVMDGQKTPPTLQSKTVPCPACRRPLVKTARKCMYCGKRQSPPVA